MNKQSSLLAAVMMATAAISSAQDSVSKTAGLPGDAIDPFTAPDQINDYVVDLVDFTSGWGTTWGIAPLVKSSKGDITFFNNGISSQYASSTLKTLVSAPRASYSLWTTPGGGINNNASLNDAGSPVVPPAQTTQFATTMAEFATGSTHVVTTIGNFDPLNPSRLYVSRIQAMLNGTSDLDTNGAIGMGSVDSDGNTYIRADDFGLGGSDQITGNNIYRVDALARSGSVVNVLKGSEFTGTGSAGSTADATIALVYASGTTYNTPGNVPEQTAGRPIYRGSNFGGTLAYESAPEVVSTTTAHLGAAPDHRGNTGYSNAVIFPGSIGTSMQYAKNGGGETRNLLLYGTTATGAVMGTASLPVPASVSDGSFTFPEAGDSIGEFIHASSQVAFRGGNGQVAVAKDLAGRGLAAAVIPSDDSAMPIWATENPQNALVVARFDPANIGGTLEWELVAYTDNVGTTGKAILDGPGGTAIGQLVWMDTATGGAVVGPSISNPMIDSVGNIWFTAGVELFGMPSDFDTALIRAVYDPATFTYELELVLELGDTFHGANSDRDWQIQFIGVADSNSISSGSLHNNNMTQTAFNAESPAALTQTESKTMGGMVLNVGLVYDWDNDGMFDVGAGSDQNYTALVYIGHTGATCGSGTVNYCTAGVSANSCQATLSTVGTASATAATGFTVTATNVEGNKDGLFFIGTNGQQAQPWGNGTSFQCVVPPVKRMGLLASNGTNGACDGTKSQDFNAKWTAEPAKNPGSGATVQAQLWYRDPLNTSNQTTSLSDAIEFTVCP